MKPSIISSILLLFFLGAGDASDEAGFIPLFNGKDLSGWTYGPNDSLKSGQGYHVDPARKTIYSTEKDGGNLFTEKQCANFILRFEFKLTPNGNNGIGIRAPVSFNTSTLGMEIQVLDETGPAYHKPNPEIQPWQYHGSIYNVVPAKSGHLRPVGEWNQEEISAIGRHIQVTLNGVVIVDANLDDVKDPATLKKHPGLQRTTGHIGFLGHGSRVDFRNLRLKPLPD